ncbi:MAG: HEAT repeat domain-containing protein [Thermodesulfobacteriota bacterium]
MAAELEKIVLEALDSEDPNVLKAACLMAGSLALAQAERGLIKALAHKVWPVRAEAAKALGRLGSKGAAPYLRRLIKASEADLRQKLLAAAADQTKTAVEPGPDEQPAEVRRAAAVALNQIDPGITQDALLAALGADQPALVNAAMLGLANLESTGGRERMVKLLGHAEPAVRRTAAACLGRLRETAAVPGLLALLADADAEARREAVIALNHIKDRRALAPLAERLADADAEVRRVAAIALGNTKSRDEKVIAALVKGLTDHEAKVRLACLSALANLKAGEALEAAAALMGDTHEAVVRQAAVTAQVLALARERPDYEAE